MTFRPKFSKNKIILPPQIIPQPYSCHLFNDLLHLCCQLMMNTESHIMHQNYTCTELKKNHKTLNANPILFGAYLSTIELKLSNTMVCLYSNPNVEHQKLYNNTH